MLYALARCPNAINEVEDIREENVGASKDDNNIGRQALIAGKDTCNGEDLLT